MVGDRDFVRDFVVFFHRTFETADTFSDSFAQFGELLGSEYEQSNSKNYQQITYFFAE
jgi:hypothetical protein